MQKLFNKKMLPCWALLFVAVLLAATTFVEKFYGTAFVYQYVYGAWWFCVLWGLLVAFSLLPLLKNKSYKNTPLFVFHLSFVVILLGALCTKIAAQQGYVVLKQNETTTVFRTNEGEVALPFEIKLDNFFIQYYPGTDAPANYVSQVTISSDSETFSTSISMNNILSYRGYRFYQSSYEPNGTSVLSINRDPWGIPITYAGYALFALSFLWLMASPKNKFRQLLKQPVLQKTAVLLLLLLPTTASATVLTADKLTAGKEQAETFGKRWMLYDGRITPVASFAQDFTIKLTGKPTFNRLNAEQFLMGFLFFPEQWQHVAVFNIKNEILKSELNIVGENASYADFFDADGEYKLAGYWKALSTGGTKSGLLKEVEKLNEKIQLIGMLHNGDLLKLFPQADNEGLKWYTFNNSISLENDTYANLSQHWLSLYGQSLHKEDQEEANNLLTQLNNYQQKNAGNFLPSETHKTIEIFYLKNNFPSLLFKVNLTLGILWLFFSFFLSEQKRNTIHMLFFVLLIASFLLLCISIGLRTYIAGRLPFSNGFETMLLMAACAMLMAILLNKKIPFVLPFGFLVSGCTLLVAHLGMMNPKITPLVPVLSSPWLSIHVSCIMISYTLFAFVALNGLFSILKNAISRKANGEKNTQFLQQNKIYSQICLYPALFFLGVGIFVGAIWANVSWGRYWGWDPKEVWALITFLVYSLLFHEKNIRFLSSPLGFHIFSLLAFLTVLMTYFGVNYFLSGMHSYA